MNRMQDKYNKEIVASLQKQLGAKSSMQIPRLDKIVINICMSEAVQNPKVVTAAAEELISGRGSDRAPFGQGR